MPGSSITAVPEGYTEHAPSPALRPFVECFWTRRTTGVSQAAPSIVIPDGCIDILLGYDSGAEYPRAALAVGTMTRALVLEGNDHSTFLGVRFRPGRAHPFLGIPAAALTDLRVEVSDVWRRGRPPLETFDASDITATIARLEALLLRRLEGGATLSPAVQAAVRAILRAQGNISIATLAPALGVTRQHLARAFALHVGVPPKTFARVARMRSVLARARAAARVDWTALALGAGYYDQAHLVSEMKELTGRTPGEWVSLR